MTFYSVLWPECGLASVARLINGPVKCRSKPGPIQLEGVWNIRIKRFLSALELREINLILFNEKKNVASATSIR